MSLLRSNQKCVLRAPAQLCEPADLIPGMSSSFRKKAKLCVRRVPAKGSQSWAGVLNTHFWFDLKSDIAAVLLTQSLPFVEPRFVNLYGDFERAVYAEGNPARARD